MRERIVKGQKIKSKKSKYNYIEYQKDGLELSYANPDVLQEGDGMYIQSDPELSDSVRVLVSSARRELTPLQFKVFSLLTGLDGRVPLTIRETGLKMGIHPSRIQRQWEIIRERLQEIYER